MKPTPTWWCSSLCTAQCMGALDLFSVNIDLPSISRDVGQSSLTWLRWILDAYA